ncbi:MAG: hypothetical protein HQK63_04065 [Desulfamplus sp.]|nr:hypothetical protein [Desulfamplus sp.]
MDYQLFRNILSPYLVDNMSGIQEVKKYADSISVEDAFDKKFLTVLNNIISCFETNEAIKSLALTILEEADFFSDTSIHKTTKSKYLDKILSDSDYIEHTKSFNLSVIQTYVEKIIHKQLYEINIKIEENQRSLNKIEATSGRMREEVQQTNLAQQANQVQQANLAQQVNQIRQSNQSLSNLQHNRALQNRIPQTDKMPQPEQPQRKVVPPPARQIELQSSNKMVQATASAPQEAIITPNQQQVRYVEQPHNSSDEVQLASATSSFLLVEIDQEQCAITYGNVAEILKSDKPVPEKILKLPTIPYNKLVGFARGFSVLRKVGNIQIDKKRSFNNLNATLTNKEDKRFAVIVAKEDDYKIIFVDYIVYAEPVDAQELGEYAKTVEGQYKIIK